MFNEIKIKEKTTLKTTGIIQRLIYEIEPEYCKSCDYFLVVSFDIMNDNAAHSLFIPVAKWDFKSEILDYHFMVTIKNKPYVIMPEKITFLPHRYFYKKDGSYRFVGEVNKKDMCAIANIITTMISFEIKM